jgi:hypothetical protein
MMPHMLPDSSPDRPEPVLDQPLRADSNKHKIKKRCGTLQQRIERFSGPIREVTASFELGIDSPGSASPAGVVVMDSERCRSRGHPE